MFAQARMIKTKSNIINQDNEITNTLKKNIFPNPTHFPVHYIQENNVEVKQKRKEGKRLR